MRTAGAYKWEPVAPAKRLSDTSHTVTSLLDETDYEFRVMAENRAGLSQPSDVSKSAKFGLFWLIG